jgi:hypothetical protein
MSVQYKNNDIRNYLPAKNAFKESLQTTAREFRASFAEKLEIIMETWSEGLDILIGQVIDDAKTAAAFGQVSASIETVAIYYPEFVGKATMDHDRIQPMWSPEEEWRRTCRSYIVSKLETEYGLTADVISEKHFIRSTGPEWKFELSLSWR